MRSSSGSGGCQLTWYDHGPNSRQSSRDSATGTSLDRPVRTVIAPSYSNVAVTANVGGPDDPSACCGCGTSVGPTRAPVIAGRTSGSASWADSGTGDQSVRSTAEPGSGATARDRSAGTMLPAARRVAADIQP